MPIYLTTVQVLFIHARLIAETGGDHGVLDLGSVQSAVARPQATFEGNDVYPDLFAKSAALLQSLIGNHSFVDGNKRTGVATAGLFLKVNGYRLNANQQTLEGFTLKCAQGLMSLDKMILWYKRYTETIS